ncbi:hypothetical protein PSAC2689_60190 [Paraburkholderia sacchari]
MDARLTGYGIESSDGRRVWDIRFLWFNFGPQAGAAKGVMWELFQCDRAEIAILRGT